MPSPFPGMDPYLESPDHWRGVHTKLMSVIQDQLVPKLRGRYFVDIKRRVYVLEESDPGYRVVVPDLVLSPRKGAASRTTRAHGGASVASLLLMGTDETEVRESRIVIRGLRDREVVTVIEIMSPTNKVAGSRGRDEYLAKRREVLRSSTHLVEIDLLRAGERFPSAVALPRGGYYVHVSRSWRRPFGEVFAWSVRDRAPRISIPLRKAEAEVVLDLGRAIRETYDRVGYDRVLEYDRSAEPPLSRADQAWARALVERLRRKRRGRPKGGR